MDKAMLKDILTKEKNEVATSRSFAEWENVNKPITYEKGSGKDWYQVEIEVLEKKSDYVHIAIAVDDGSWFRSRCPLSTSFIVYKNGKIDK